MHHYEEEAMQKAIEIQKGRILAKAIIRRANGNYEAVIVYAGSLPNNFFFSYRLRSPRSPRKSWKRIGTAIRNHAVSFQAYVAQYAITSTVVSVKVYYAKKLRELMEKKDLDFYGPRRELQPWETQRLRAKEAGKLRGGYSGYIHAG